MRQPLFPLVCVGLGLVLGGCATSTEFGYLGEESITPGDAAWTEWGPFVIAPQETYVLDVDTHAMPSGAVISFVQEGLYLGDVGKISVYESTPSQPLSPLDGCGTRCAGDPVPSSAKALREDIGGGFNLNHTDSVLIRFVFRGFGERRDITFKHNCINGC